MSSVKKFVLPCLGHSQWPTIPHGSLVEGIQDCVAEIRVGDLIAFRKSQRVLCHRVIQIHHGGPESTYLTKGDRNLFHDGWVTPKNILGLVTFVNGISTETFWLRQLTRLFLAIATLQAVVIFAAKFCGRACRRQSH